MGTLTIRRLDDETKTRLRLAAALKGVSMEEEARTLIAAAFSDKAKRKTSNLTATQIMDMARALPDENPVDDRFRTMTQKEISDVLNGEFEGL